MLLEAHGSRKDSGDDATSTEDEEDIKGAAGTLFAGVFALSTQSEATLNNKL